MRLSRRQFLLGSAGAGVALAPLGWYGAVHEPADLEVVRRSLTIPNLPPRLDGMTVVQVSDLHLGQIGAVHRQMLEQVRALQPAAVFVTGDVVDEDVALGDAADLLASFQAPQGTWAVPGHREHAVDVVYTLGGALKSRNVRLLVNQAVALEDGFWIIGVDDPSGRNDDVPNAVKQVPTGAVRILLAHSPDIVERLGGNRFDLILAGHTHGAQVNLPTVRDIWLRDDLARRYVAGLYQVGNSRLYVNRGIGTFYLPVRIGARPEITLFTFRGA